MKIIQEKIAYLMNPGRLDQFIFFFLSRRNTKQRTFHAIPSAAMRLNLPPMLYPTRQIRHFK
jgi:hypothetical protein